MVELPARLSNARPSGIDYPGHLGPCRQPAAGLSDVRQQPAQSQPSPELSTSQVKETLRPPQVCSRPHERAHGSSPASCAEVVRSHVAIAIAITIAKGGAGQPPS